MTKILHHKWSLLSGAITLAHFLTLYGIAEYYDHHGMTLYGSGLSVQLLKFHLVSTLLSVVTAVIAVVRERPWVFGVVAFLLGGLSLFLYMG